MDPHNVKSPRNRWILIDVLNADMGENDALAVGEWEGKKTLAIRWNGDSEDDIGSPQSRGIATWFIVPSHYNKKIIELEQIPESKKTLARALLGIDGEAA